MPKYEQIGSRNAWAWVVVLKLVFLMEMDEWSMVDSPWSMVQQMSGANLMAIPPSIAPLL
jgi:hypothetical protein